MVVCGVPALDAVLAQNDHRTQSGRLRNRPRRTTARRAAGDHDHRTHPPELAKCRNGSRSAYAFSVIDDRGEGAIEIRRDKRLGWCIDDGLQSLTPSAETGSGRL